MNPGPGRFYTFGWGLAGAVAAALPVLAWRKLRSMIMRHPLEVHTVGSFEMDARIRAVTIAGVTVYTLHDEADRHVATCSSPARLARFAVDSGAVVVRHDYDLVQAHAHEHGGRS